MFTLLTFHVLMRCFCRYFWVANR